ncbi:hypothetical protein ILUMI_25224 [Ignelater luminosus]|uniref:Cytochrome b5 heme-binding domain-containing protein n=1 Tax=Ignelater luminosus TaxID=2038154 RepID=A0A8K0C5S8_IGNLU|nr:hypothetical protein ILUMI_25224 [Ignelater luminosus]
MQNPLNIALLIAVAFLAFKILKPTHAAPAHDPSERELPKLRKDFTIEELKKYDGTQEDGRILVAVNGNVYDVTKGKRFYGPDGPYSVFAGCDASRGLATHSVECKTDGYDDLSDLNSMEMESLREWETLFIGKYEYVGRLLRPGEQPTNYSGDEEEEESSSAGNAAVASEGGGHKKKNK